MTHKKTRLQWAGRGFYLLVAGVLAFSFTRPATAGSAAIHPDNGGSTDAVTAATTRSQPAVVPETAENDTTVHMSVDILPAFPGGSSEMLRFLSENIHYPDSCKENRIEGRVLLQFVVKKDGSVSEDIKVLKSPHPDLTAEAIRVIRQSPKWTPGIKDGRPVNSYLAIPVNFRLKQ